MLAGLLHFWRHRRLPGPSPAGSARCWSLAALVVPTHLGPVQRAWMGLAHAISKVTTPIFMGVVFFVRHDPDRPR